MKRRSIVRIISFLCAAIIVTSGFTIKTVQKKNEYKLQIENNYSRSLNELTAAVNNIALTLQKAKYANTAEHLGEMAVKLLTETEISKNALSQLPSGANLETLNRFLSQVGNYAISISGQLYNGEDFPKDYSDNISALCDIAQKVSESINDAQINYNNLEYWASELDKKLDENVSQSLSGSFSNLEGELTDYPTLVYDGPYSDHILKKEAEMLKGADEISQEKAKEIAVSFLACNPEDLHFISEEKGKIPSYRFSGSNCDITISKAGGYVVYMRKNRKLGDYVLTQTQASDKAKRFLDKNEISGFVQTYYFTDEGVCVINFAYLDGRTICYTDLIKVGVAMDSGEIVFFESSGYLSNHKERAFETPSYTLEQAREIVSGNLTINKTAIALIPTAAGEERCYEFVCSDGDQEVLVYINVTTLAEEEILILLKGDGGILVK